MLLSACEIWHRWRLLSRNVCLFCCSEICGDVLAFSGCGLLFHKVHAAEQIVCPMPVQSNMNAEFCQLCVVLWHHNTTKEAVTTSVFSSSISTAVCAYLYSSLNKGVAPFLGRKLSDVIIGWVSFVLLDSLKTCQLDWMGSQFADFLSPLRLVVNTCTGCLCSMLAGILDHFGMNIRCVPVEVFNKQDLRNKYMCMNHVAATSYTNTEVKTCRYLPVQVLYSVRLRTSCRNLSCLWTPLSLSPSCC